jgi:hypothetical protein
LNTSRKGNAAELKVRKDKEAKGYIAGSRRHVGGAGDWIFVHPGGDVQLVEVKACKNLWEGFRRADRQEMRETLLPLSGSRWVANIRGGKIEYIHERDWP